MKNRTRGGKVDGKTWWGDAADPRETTDTASINYDVELDNSSLLKITSRVFRHKNDKGK